MLDKMQISCRSCDLCGTKLYRAFIFALVLYTSMASPLHLGMLRAQPGSKICPGPSVYNSLQISSLKKYESHMRTAKSLGSTCLGEPSKSKHSTETQQRNGHESEI